MDGGLLRAFLLVSVLLFGQWLYALEARVLIDEKNHFKTLSGEMRVVCTKSFAKSCPKKTYILPYGTWHFERRGHFLKIKKENSRAKVTIPGTHFQITGSFAMDGHLLQRLEVATVNRNTLWVVHLPVDQYLYGVMAAEVPASWPMETLKAQAVASRTYFLFKKLGRRNEAYDVRSDILDQVFKLDAKKYKSIGRAISATHGLVLMSDKDSQIFPAYFHSDCGGGTSGEDKVWRKPTSYNKAVKDPYCKTASKNNWTYYIDRHKLLYTLKKIFYLPEGVELQSILPRLQKASRAYIVDFIFSENIVKRISANELRKILGYGRLKSTNFEVFSTWRDVVFRGRGFGHGVGMCQWGAQRWARKGKDFRFILKHYYPEAHLKRVDPKSFENLQAQFSF